MVEVAGVELVGRVSQQLGSVETCTNEEKAQTATAPLAPVITCPLLAKVVANWSALPDKIKQAIAGLAET